MSPPTGQVTRSRAPQDAARRAGGLQRLRLAAVAAALTALLGACATTGTGQRAAGDPYASYVKARLAEKLARPGAGPLFLAVAEQGLADGGVAQSALFHLIIEGRMAAAADLARRLKDAPGEDSLPHLLDALEALRAGNGDAALEALAGLKANGFSQVLRPVVAAWAEALLGRADAALQALRPLEQRYGLSRYVKMERALLLDYLGESERAATAYKGLVYGRGLPSLEPLKAYLALLVRLGRRDEAITVLADMEKANPAMTVLADIRRKLEAGGKPAALAATPPGGVAVMLLELAEEIAREDLLRPAVLYARLAAWLAPGLTQARVRLIDLLSRAGYHSLARDEAQTIPKTSPWWAAARRAAALAARRAGDAAQAVAILRDYLRGAPEDIDSWVLLGDLLRLAERYDEAADAYGRAIAQMRARELTPGWYPYFARGIAYERAGAWAKAEADFLVALDKKPDEADLLNYLGYSWLDRGMRTDEAMTLIERAAALKPEDGAIVDSLGWAYYVRGEIQKAVDTLERAVLLMPNDPTINEHLGDAYWRAGRRREARFQWAHALAFDPPPERRPVLERKLRLGLTGEDAPVIAEAKKAGS